MNTRVRAAHGSMLCITLIAFCARPAHAQEIWLGAAEIAELPMEGLAWEHVSQAAEGEAGKPDLSDPNQENNVLVLAKALVFARTGKPSLREEVQQACRLAMGTEKDGNALALGRKLCAYVVAADLIQSHDEQFAGWLRHCLTVELRGKTLVSTHEKRPNNWGTHAGATRLAIALYLDDYAEVERVAQVFRGWTGDLAAYDGFKFGNLSWQADPQYPRAVNPLGANRQGMSIDGALPDEMRRGGRFRNPPIYTGYPWGALQGAFAQAEMLHRRGYPAYEWEDRALLRAVEFLYEVECPAGGDDEWLLWIVNHRYGEYYPANDQPAPGKNMAWTNWTHALTNKSAAASHTPGPD